MDKPTTGTSSESRGQERPRKRDTRQCRICLAGSEEEHELGPLIKPCKCKGSIRYVHVQCINTWRKTGSATNQNFWACPQCGHKYNISRTKILGFSNSPWVLGPTTLALFLAIVFAASFIVSYFIPELDDPMLLVAPPLYDDLGLTWHTPLGIASDVIRETVHAFAEVSTPREVLLEARRRESLRNIEDTTVWGLFKKKIPFRKAGKVDSGKRRVVGRRIDPRAPYSPSEEGPRVTLWTRLLRKFMVGLSLVGILSFLNLLITMSLFGPLQIARARWIRGGRREPGGVRDIGTILIIIFVLIGVARALYGVYSITKMLAQFVLLKAENAILEVQDDDDKEEEEEEEPINTQEPKDNTASGPLDNGSSPNDLINYGPATGTARTENKAAKRPIPLSTNGTCARNVGDEFGDELPDTPGGWKGEWDL